MVERTQKVIGKKIIIVKGLMSRYFILFNG